MQREEDMMPRAAIYVRVSTQQQAEHGVSLPDQVAQCRAYCERQGWEVAEIFSEPGASALDEDRPQFQEMVYKATRSDKPFEFVVVHSLSRFSRDTMHSEIYVRKLRKAGVQLVSITQDISQDGSGDMFRKFVNVFDEYQSRENAKHVHRAMVENARQGFWNGSLPPYGYRSVVAERRGNKEKKVLAIDEDEARVVRLAFEMAEGRDGRPMGIKAIASWLNERGIMRRGKRFSTGNVHRLLTSTTYYGQHYFNRDDVRNERRRPPSEWIAYPVPPIVPEETFNAVQGLLASRSPKQTPPRVTNGPTFLAGIARCARCGAAMILNTGKGGQYRYYACSRAMKEGRTGCKGMRIRMDKLDGVVIDEVARRVLEPSRLTEMLQTYVKAASDRDRADRDRLSKLRADHEDAKAGIQRLLGLVEKGLMHDEDPEFRGRLRGLKVRREEIGRELADMQKRMVSGEPQITPDKVARLSCLIRDKLHDGPPELRQAYGRLLMEEVSVGDHEIRITGSKAALARAASGPFDKAASAVLSSVREWWS